MASKTILGLDLGTTSIGFAHVIEGDTPEQIFNRKNWGSCCSFKR
jgi:RNase H-fold protein (predicted Holliday junction resolvase)